MNLIIDEVIDKGLYYKKISNDKVINITSEGRSGKSTLANGYKNNNLQKIGVNKWKNFI